MKILIISVNRNRLPAPVLPVGACMAAEAASDSGHETRLLDFMFGRNPARRLEQELEDFRPDVVGISVRNIDNNDIQSPVLFAEELLPVMKMVRERSSAAVVLGGPAISIMPEVFLNYTSADFAIAGNSDPAFSLLLEKLAAKEIPLDIPGVHGHGHSGNENGMHRAAPSPDAFRFPDFRAWVDWREYRSSMVSIPLKTKTGCEFQCVHCTYDTIDGGGRVLCEPDKVVEAIGKYSRQGFKNFEFVDNVFNSPYSHAMDVCEGIARSGIRAGFECMDVNPLHFDGALLGAMERAGFRGIGITVESASDPVLQGFKKGFASVHARKAAETIRRGRIPCMWFFMMGGPGETRETVGETLGFARECIRSGDPAYFTIGIRIYPGTALELLARDQGMLTANADGLLRPAFYVSPELDKAWLARRMKEEASRRMNFLIAGESGFAPSPWVLSLGRTLRMKPPLWRHIRPLRMGMRLLRIGG